MNGICDDDNMWKLHYVVLILAVMAALCVLGVVGCAMRRRAVARAAERAKSVPVQNQMVTLFRHYDGPSNPLSRLVPRLFLFDCCDGVCVHLCMPYPLSCFKSFATGVCAFQKLHSFITYSISININELFLLDICTCVIV